MQIDDAAWKPLGIVLRCQCHVMSDLIAEAPFLYFPLFSAALDMSLPAYVHASATFGHQFVVFAVAPMHGHVRTTV